MAGYTNSAGNTSASNQIGQFRYFTSSMDKLGTYKATGINIPIPKANIPQQVNWAATTANTLVKSMGVYEAYRDQQFKRAEEYLNTHSIDDYKKAMSDGDVPFQYDYLAMTKLKEGYGKIVSSLATQDFKNLVDRNYFQGKTPEEVDAAFYTHLQDSIKEFDDGTLGFSTDDYFFNKGVYEDANKTRIGMMTEHAVVEDEFLQQQFEQQQLAMAKDLANDPSKPINEIIDNLKNNILSTGYRATPAFANKLLNTFTSELANNPKGASILRSIGDLEVYNGTTLREYMGEHAYQEALINAESFRFKTDAKYRMDFQQGVDKWVQAGDVASIQAALNQHIKTNGNVQDAEYEYLLKAVDQAQRVQEANAKAAAKGNLHLQAAEELYKIELARSHGEKVETPEQVKQRFEATYGPGAYTSNLVKVTHQRIVNEALVKAADGDTEPLRILMNQVIRPSMDNMEFETYLADGLKDTFNDVQRVIDETVATGAPIDESKKIEYMQKFQALQQMYHLNPYAFTKILGENYKDLSDKFRRMDIASRIGLDPIQQEVKITNAERAMRDEKYKSTQGASSFANYRIPMQKVEYNSGNLSQRLAYSELLTAMTKSRAAEQMEIDPDLSATDALKASAEQVTEEFGVLTDGKIVVSKSLLTSHSNFIGIAKVDPNDYMELSGLAFVDILKESGDFEEVSLDTYNNTYIGQDSQGAYIFVVVDSLGRHLGDIPVSAVAARADKMLEAQGNEAISRLNNLKVHKNLPNVIGSWGSAPNYDPTAVMRNTRIAAGLPTDIEDEDE